MKVDMNSAAFKEFCETAFAIQGNDVSKEWLAEIFAGANSDMNRAVNHLLDTPDDKVVRGDNASLGKASTVSATGFPVIIEPPKKSGTVRSTPAATRNHHSIGKTTTSHLPSVSSTTMDFLTSDFSPQRQQQQTVDAGAFASFGGRTNRSRPMTPVIVAQPPPPPQQIVVLAPPVPVQTEEPSKKTLFLEQRSDEQKTQITGLEQEIQKLRDQADKLEVLQQSLKTENEKKDMIVTYDADGNARGRYSNAILQIGGKQDLIQMQLVHQQEMLQNVRNALLVQESRLARSEGAKEASNNPFAPKPSNNPFAEEVQKATEKQLSKSCPINKVLPPSVFDVLKTSQNNNCNMMSSPFECQLQNNNNNVNFNSNMNYPKNNYINNMMPSNMYNSIPNINSNNLITLNNGNNKNNMQVQQQLLVHPLQKIVEEEENNNGDIKTNENTLKLQQLRQMQNNAMMAPSMHNNHMNMSNNNNVMMNNNNNVMMSHTMGSKMNMINYGNHNNYMMMSNPLNMNYMVC